VGFGFDKVSRELTPNYLLSNRTLWIKEPIYIVVDWFKNLSN